MSNDQQPATSNQQLATNDQRPTTFHPKAWLVWVLTGLVVGMVARNPLYSLVVLLAVRLVALTHGVAGQGIALPLGKLAVSILGFSAVFNGLFVHVGETVLGELPAFLPLIGGKITLEALLFGAGNGLVLLVLLVVFMALNNIVPAFELVRLIPNALRDVGVVVLIAVTYVPETTRHLTQIREAQAIRGHELRGLRDWRPVVIPLLVGGMERAMGVAEAMVARGYGATGNVGASVWVRVGYLLGLMAVLGGWFLSFWWGWVGWVLLGMGGVFVGCLLWWQGKKLVQSRYKPVRWGWQDGGLVLLCVGIFLVVLFRGGDSLFWSPYPSVEMPAFNAWVGLALAGLGMPALVGGKGND